MLSKVTKITLGTLAEEAALEERWQQLAQYFRHRNQGLRKDAFLALDTFLDQAAAWPFEERIRVARWIADRHARLFKDARLLPQPLLLALVSPTLWEWVELEPFCAEAHFLVAMVAVSAPEGIFAHKPFHLRRAIALDPSHEEARVELVQWLTSGAEYNQHELPCGYLGDAEADLEELHEADRVAQMISDTGLRDRIGVEIKGLQRVASSWLAFRQSRHADFATWCAEHE
jgi:hypothetical protein